MRLLLGAALSGALLMSAGAVQAADLACADPSGGPDFANTRWAGTTEWEGVPASALSIFLRQDCVVEYVSRGVTYTNGTWVQRGSMVEWQSNDHFAVYVGKADADQLDGVMYNRRGQKGAWRFKRAD